MRFLFSILILSFLGVVACKKSSSSAMSLDQIQLNKIPSGDIFKLAKDGNSKLTLINFWASWCGPCRSEFPDLLKLRANYKNQGLGFHFVSVDFEGDIMDAKTFLAEQKVDFLTYIKEGDDQAFINTIDKTWSGALPATFVLDSQGKILRRFDGPVTYGDLEKAVKKYLFQNETKGKTL